MRAFVSSLRKTLNNIVKETHVHDVISKKHMFYEEKAQNL